jgi:hypothetical protein
MAEELTLRNFVFERLKPAVETELKRLERANADSDLSQVSWRTRNLFELMIWAEHCSKSEQAAKGFCEDGECLPADNSINTGPSGTVPGLLISSGQILRLVPLLNGCKRPIAVDPGIGRRKNSNGE